MSQVSFHTLYCGFPVEVVAGWDPPLQYYHFTVFDKRMDAEEECIYSCLNEGMDVFKTKTTDRWKEKLASLNIQAPEGFWSRVELKEGNVLHVFADGQWRAR